MPEAHAEERPLQLANPAPDGPLLRHQPGMLVDVPDVHRPAHDPQHVIIVEHRNRLAGIEFHRIPRDPILLQELAEDAGMFAIDVLEDQKAHGNPFPCQVPKLKSVTWAGGVNPGSRRGSSTGARI